MSNEHFVILSLALWVVAFGISLHFEKKLRAEWEKNSNEWRKMAEGAIAEVQFWRRREAARNPVIYARTSDVEGLTTYILDTEKVH